MDMAPEAGALWFFIAGDRHAELLSCSITPEELVPRDDITVFGAAYSVYVRSVRLALAEKGLAYHLQEVDIFAPGGPSADYLSRHPFGRIPAFEHRREDAVFQLYETGAILRYVDEAFAGPQLQPDMPQARARMNQLIAILDNYAYRCLVWDIYVERVSRPGEGKASDEARIEGALPLARSCPQAISDLRGDQLWLAGAELTLADLHAAAIFAYFTAAPEAEVLLRPHAGLRDWWRRMTQRDSLRTTAYPGE